MANWFKVYETDLDESRLKYALSKLPEVGWVWMGILSECCKHRSDSIRWSPRHHELFGFSERLKVSIPKINEAILLLHEIEYIQFTEGKNDASGTIKVLKWNDKQSDYCVRKDRGDYKKNGEYRRVSDNIGESPREERRREENREEETKFASLPIDSFEIPKSLQTSEFMSAWDKWHTFRRSGKKVKHWKVMFESQLEMLSKYSPDQAVQILNKSIMNGWTGLFEPKQARESTPAMHNGKPLETYYELTREPGEDQKSWDKRCVALSL